MSNEVILIFLSNVALNSVVADFFTFLALSGGFRTRTGYITDFLAVNSLCNEPPCYFNHVRDRMKNTHAQFVA